jgi:hypothetical protein
MFLAGPRTAKTIRTMLVRCAGLLVVAGIPLRLGVFERLLGMGLFHHGRSCCHQG